jgi:glucose-1-phosphate adenylyltransferase
MLSKQVVAVILGVEQVPDCIPMSYQKKTCCLIAGKYRLVDIPISNQVNSSINRMFVLTQYTSASLNKHIKNTYQFSGFTQDL